jgi:hypothetical protein
VCTAVRGKFCGFAKRLTTIGEFAFVDILESGAICRQEVHAEARRRGSAKEIHNETVSMSENELRAYPGAFRELWPTIYGILNRGWRFSSSRHAKTVGNCR